VGDVGNIVLRDRKHLSQDGLLIVAMAVNRDEEKLVSGPDIVSRGFIYVKDNEDIIDETLNLVREILANNSLAGDNWPDLKNIIKDEVHQFVFEKIKRNPMILPIILDV
jgi:ribonuclease J